MFPPCVCDRRWQGSLYFWLVCSSIHFAPHAPTVSNSVVLVFCSSSELVIIFGSFGAMNVHVGRKNSPCCTLAFGASNNMHPPTERRYYRSIIQIYLVEIPSSS